MGYKLYTYNKRKICYEVCSDIKKYLDGKENGKEINYQEYDIASKYGTKLFAKLFDELGEDLYNEKGRMEIPILIWEKNSKRKLIAQGKKIREVKL